MQHGRHRLIIFLFILLSAVSSQAALSPLLSPDFYLGKGFEWVLAISSHLGRQEYSRIVDSIAERRVLAAVASIHRYPAWNYRYKNIKVIIIRGVDGEPNAVSIGPVIYISHSLFQRLNDLELTAVLAHEMAHSEKAHLLQRVPVPLGATFLELAHRVFWGQVSPAEATSYFDAVRETIQTVNFSMELQADCFAAKQLAYMQTKGLPNKPQDLISASTQMLGYDVSKDISDEPAAIRARTIQARMYEGSCEFSPEL